MDEPTGVTGRRETLRAAIMAAAEARVAASGLENLGVREIAQEAGCSSGMVYKLFASHDELVLAINARTLAALEDAIAERLRTLAAGRPPWPEVDVDRAVPWLEARAGLTLLASQREALRLALGSKVLVITDGPGVGKTSMVDVPLMRAVLRALPDGAVLLLVGDVDQLPSVGPGQVLPT